jgi:hypothetical protein
MEIHFFVLEKNKEEPSKCGSKNLCRIGFCFYMDRVELRLHILGFVFSSKITLMQLLLIFNRFEIENYTDHFIRVQ